MEDILAALTEDVSIVLLPSVLYRSAQLLDMAAITRAAHEKGIICGFDLCHSIGAVDHDMEAVDCDLRSGATTSISPAARARRRGCM